ncbi:DUF1508 domain-containing protein [Sphingomonas sp. LM7]|uniref:DUF1508 domain-containing protein n=1 Tax=Sphingomonas sp. LM7 TaxID=1938607 RepID=UPI000983D734|nr:DUF1508 domain-containing protein [Sphingomonas sp. LM7]AQR72795.1 hypothetical protein BXU08_03110 [Sphingomonas sp. LM7]
MNLFAGALSAEGLVACADQDLRPAGEAQAYFEIYRADRIKLTSVLFSGEDWRWRFCSGAGLTVASGDGFGSERECVAAVNALRTGAGTASVRGSSLQS